MYKCLHCGYVFEEPATYSEDCTPGGVFESGSFINRYEGCPKCSCGYEEVFECDDCGNFLTLEEAENKDKRYYCTDCFEERYADM